MNWYKSITNTHVKRHGVTIDEYTDMFPDAKLCSISTIEKLRQNALNSPNSGFQKGHQINDGSWTWNKGLTKHTDARIAKYAELATGKELTEEHKARISEAATGRPGLTGSNNPMFGKTMTQEEKDLRYTSEWYDALIAGLKNSRRKGLRKTKPELEIERFLNCHAPVGWEYTGDHSFWLRLSDKRRKNPDFTNRDHKRVIEVFGRYWHPDPGEESDLVNMYKNIGWECLVVWDDEVSDLPSKVYQFLDLEHLFDPMHIDDITWHNRSSI